MCRPIYAHIWFNILREANFFQPFKLFCKLVFWSVSGCYPVSFWRRRISAVENCRANIGARVRRSGTLFTLRSLIVSGSRFSPSFSAVGCWKSDILFPLKEVVAVVAVGLWSILSIAAVMKSPLLRIEGHNTPSSWYLLTAASPKWAEIASTLSYETLNPWSWSSCTRIFFRVLAQTDIPKNTGKGVSRSVKCL